jgi:hypothetical protein
MLNGLAASAGGGGGGGGFGLGAAMQQAVNSVYSLMGLGGGGGAPAAAPPVVVDGPAAAVLTAAQAAAGGAPASRLARRARWRPRRWRLASRRRLRRATLGGGGLPRSFAAVRAASGRSRRRLAPLIALWASGGVAREVAAIRSRSEAVIFFGLYYRTIEERRAGIGIGGNFNFFSTVRPTHSVTHTGSAGRGGRCHGGVTAAWYTHTV